MTTDQLLLIDLSGLAHALFHVSGNEPDPNFISTALISRVRALASNHPHAAICCDSGKSFRHDLEPAYKANRDTENRAVIKHQMTLACETLAADGFPVWAAKGFEADDVIASATARAVAIDGAEVLIASDDKDLLQLVSDRVTVKKLRDGTLRTPEIVKENLKVLPSQVLDYLCLVGDASDNVKGADGIGAVKAAKLLTDHGSLEAVYAEIDRGVVPGITPTMRTSLQEFRARWPLVKSLIALRTDVEIPFEEIAAERTAKPMTEYDGMDSVVQSGEHFGADYSSAGEDSQRSGEVAGSTPAAVPQRELTKKEAADELQAAASRVSERIKANESMVRAADVLPPVEFSQQLEPRSMDEAVRLAQRMFESRLFSAYGTPQAVLATVLAGRELGIGAMKSLRSFHIIENRPSMSADLIAGQVLSSGKAKYFKPVNRTATAATFKTLRVGDDEEPFELTYTIEEARQAWKKDQRAWDASGWGKTPADMLVARCKSKLARLVYPDVVSGLYAPEEME